MPPGRHDGPMAGLKHCQKCGAEMPGAGLSGHCPRCLVATILGSEEPVAGSGLEVALRRFGDFELIAEIARGGMGVVYRARQVSLNRMVALKMILGGELATPDSVRRFRNEAEAAARLRHPNIVSIHEVGEHEGQHYFAMELVEGPNFSALVRDGPLPAAKAAGYVQAVAEAVAHAHAQQVLHRDLKPSNILLDPFDQPRVTDFGLARQLDRGFELTLSGQTMGSPGYMSPEQAGGRPGDVSVASDVYALGAVLYHLMTGRPPFQGGNLPAVLHQVMNEEPVSPRRLNPAVPMDLETIGLKCLDKDPGRRYASAQDLADELGRFLRDEPIEARPLGPMARLGRWTRRYPVVAVLGGSVLLLLAMMVLGSVIAVWRVNLAREAEQQERTKAVQANRDLVSANTRLGETVRVLEMRRAEDLFQSGDSAAGVAHLAAILRRDPSNEIAATRLISALAHRDWALPLTPPILGMHPVEKARFHPNGAQLLTVSRDRTVRLYETFTGRPVATLPHRNRITSALYSPDGSRVLTASGDGLAQIWSSTNGAPLLRLSSHRGPVHSAEFSPDGRLVATASADKTVRIWDALTGAGLQELRAHTSPVWLARFSPDGKWIASAGDGGVVRLWNTTDWTVRYRLKNPTARIATVEFSPDSQRLVWAGEMVGAQIWDVPSGTPVGNLMAHRHADEPIWSATFSPDGRQILTACQDGTIRLWTAATGQFQGEYRVHEGGVNVGVYSPDGARIATASADNSARIWHLGRAAPVGQPMREVERLLDVCFSPSGRQLLTASYNSVVQVWDIRERQDAGRMLTDRLAVSKMAVHPDGSLMLLVLRDRTVQLLEEATGERSPLPVQGVQLAAFSPDGRWFALGCANGLVSLWETARGQQQAELPGHSMAVRWMEFSRDGTRLVTASADGTARIWNVPEGTGLKRPLVHRAEVSMARFSPDGRRVVTASEDWNARVWDAATGEPVTELLPHMDHVKSVEFSPDGQRLVTASTDNTACIWSVETGRTLTPRLRHARIVERAIFSPDGRRVATASLDRTARIWDAGNGQAITEPLVHDSQVSALGWARGGRHLLTASRSGTARLWDTETGQPMTEWLGVPEGGQAAVNFDPLGRRIVSGSHRVRVWELAAAPGAVPAWFPPFAEAVAGLRLSNRGHIELVPRGELAIQADHMREGPGSYYERFARWFLEDPDRRGSLPRE
jgi:WD40 repeat protein